MATTTLESAEVHIHSQPSTRAIRRKHHILVRISHWANVPILLGLILSGLSIYWASPVLQHPMDASGNNDYFVDFGRFVVAHLPVAHRHPTMTSDDFTSYRDNWFYNHFSLGTGELATGLRLHWLFAYLFMANGALYLIGLVVGRGFRSLLPRPADLAGAAHMQIYYIGLPFAKLLRRPWTHPVVDTKYNALQRLAYFSMPVAGVLAVLTGWAIHKPQQLSWLAALFGGYNWARVWHFWLLWLFVAFVIPHVILVLADGWDTLRSMVVGWSDRLGERDRE